MKRFAILKVGTHTDRNGKKKIFTGADLDKIAESYKPEERRTPIVVGHPELDSPSYGHIAKYEREGDFLYAVPEKVHEEFEKAVKDELFSERSVAINKDGSIRHIGFLGGTPPAIEGLGKVEFSKDDDSVEFSAPKEESATPPVVPPVTPPVEDKKSNDGKTDSDTKYQELLDKFNQLEQKLADKEKSIKQAEFAREKERLQTFVTGLINDGKIKPDMKDVVENTLLHFSASDSGYEFSAEEEPKVKKEDLELMFSKLPGNFITRIIGKDNGDVKIAKTSQDLAKII